MLQEDIDERTLDKFLNAAQSFYKTAYNYFRKWLPLNDQFLKHCQFVNFNERLKHGIEDVMQIITMMPHLQGKFQVDVSLMDQLEEEFIVHQGMSNN